jgi:amidase
MRRLTREYYFYRWSRENRPAVEILSGERLIVELWDNVRNSIVTESDYGPEDVKEVNPATGPIAVAGAEPGDTVAIHILDIKLGPVGHLQLIPGYGLLATEVPLPN